MTDSAMDRDRLRIRLRRDCLMGRWVLGLIGFVFSIPAERNIVVTLCFVGGCGDFWVLEIGFVLRKKGLAGW